MAELSPVFGADGRRVGLVSTTADGLPDPMLAAIVARYAAECAADRARRDAIRSGAIKPAPMPPAGRWLITDRD
jgi:hypothetical protein